MQSIYLVHLPFLKNNIYSTPCFRFVCINKRATAYRLAFGALTIDFRVFEGNYEQKRSVSSSTKGLGSQDVLHAKTCLSQRLECPPPHGVVSVTPFY